MEESLDQRARGLGRRDCGGGGGEWGNECGGESERGEGEGRGSGRHKHSVARRWRIEHVGGSGAVEEEGNIHFYGSIKVEEEGIRGYPWTACVGREEV